LVDLLGFELLAFEDGQAEIAYPLRHELTNALGIANGGLIMPLVDVAIAHAATPMQVAALEDCSFDGHRQDYDGFLPMKSTLVMANCSGV
jgi:hypothetical protein